MNIHKLPNGNGIFDMEIKKHGNKARNNQNTDAQKLIT